MKTKFLRIGKKSMSVVLSILMILSTVLIGSMSIGTIDASADTISSTDEDIVLFFEMHHWSDDAKNSNWWNSIGCYHYATFYGQNGTDNFTGWLRSVKTGSSESTGQGNTTDYIFYCILPAGNYSSMNLYRGKTNSLTGDFWNKRGKSFGNYNLLGTICNDSNDILWSTYTNIVDNCSASLSEPTETISLGDSYNLNPTLNDNSPLEEDSFCVVDTNKYIVKDSNGNVLEEGKDYTLSDNEITFLSAGTYTITDSVTYHEKGFSNVSLLNKTITTDSIQLTVESANTNADNVGIKVKKSDNGSDFTDTDTPTVTLTYGENSVTNDGNSTINSITSAATVAAPESYKVGETTYQFTGWTTESGEGDFGSPTLTTSTFTPRTTDVKAVAQYTKCYSVTCDTATNGTITASSLSVPVGQEYTINITPDSGYSLEKLTIDDIAVSTNPTDTTYTATMPAKNITVKATFNKTSYRLYFYDANEWGYTHIYFWNTENNSEQNNTKWPGIAMTPDETYINLYYIDIDDSVSITNCIFNNITHFITGKNSTFDSGGQTSDLQCDLSTNNGKVYNPNTDKWVTLESLSNTLKKIGSDDYYRVYFYNQATQSNWLSGHNNDGNETYPAANGNTYIQYGIRSGSDDDTATVAFNSYSRSSDNNGTYPGKAMTPITSSIYNNGALYYVDIPKGSYNFVRFSRGYWDNGQNMTMLYDFNSNNNNNKIFQLNSVNTDNYKKYKTGYKSSEITTVLSGGNWWETYRTAESSKDTAELGENEVKIFAKSGTIRDQGSSNTAQYNKYSELADTVIYADGTTEENDTEEKKHGFSYYRKDNWWSYSEAGGGYRLTLAHAEKGTKINITTTIKENYRSKYYVKAFCINGDSFNVITESQADKETGEYTCTYSIPNNVEAVEITPIYFYFENGSKDYITFNVEDFSGEVKEKWGNTIACFAWYQNGNEGATVEDETHQNALGGYPGQPMVKEGGSYYIQVPKTDAVLGDIKGITLNNYVWDDVHGYYLRQYKDFNGLDNDPDPSFNQVSDHRKKANAQTYDYDDFTALSTLDDVDEIIFSFKYRTNNNDNAVYSTSAADKGNLPEAKDIIYDSVESKFGKNGWNALVDYDDVVVDLFGNQINKYTDSQVLNQLKNSQKLFVVSDGYINYYTDSTYKENDTYPDKVHDKYLGEYATKWYVYSLGDDNTTYNYLGALPPSAFITTKVLAGLGKINDENLDTAKAEFAKYLDSEVHTEAVNKLFETYKKLFNTYQNVPVVITYESALNSNGRYGADNVNWGYRCDGRWYYSRTNGNIHANTKILIYDPDDTTSEKVTYNKKDYIEDKYATGTVDNEDGTETSVTYNYGGITGAAVCFSNSTKGLKLNGETNVEVERDKGDNFVFNAVKSSTVSKDDKDVIYVFKGWYLETGGDVLNPITEATLGSRKMNSIATFIAVYEKVSVRSLIVNHNLYAEQDLKSVDPTPHNGTGSTYVESITITDKDDKILAKFTANEANTLQTDTTAATVDSLKNNDNKVIVTIRTVPANNQTTLTNVYQYNSENTDLTKSSYNDIGTTLTYTYNVKDLFGDDTNVSKVVTLDLFSDLTSATSTIVINFKYYDRAEENNAPADISAKETVLSYTISGITDYQSLQNAIAGIIDEGTLSDKKVHAGKIENLLDNYKFWASLKQAKEGFGDMDHYKLVKDEEGNITNTKELYKNISDIELEYHTNNYSVPKLKTQNLDNEEKWVTYYDRNGKALDITSENEKDVVPSTLSSVTVWALNTPKIYNLTVYTDKTTTEKDENGNTVTKFEGRKISQLEGTDFYTFTQLDDVYSGFYNQRVGVADPNEEAAEQSDKTVPNLMGYYGITDEDNGNTGIAYTGEIVDAPLTATTADENDTNEYKFVGWYTLSNGSYVKVSSDRTYGNRITSDLTLYAMYKPTGAQVTKTNGIGVGTSVTINGIYQSELKVDNFVVEDENTGDQTQKVRLNTQLNVYYDDKMIDNDPKIKQVAVIYVNLSDDDFDENGNINSDTIITITSWLNNNKSVLTKGNDVRKSGTITFENRNILIVDSYVVGNDINLTNKNRMQFILPMSEELYDDTYNKLIAFAAIQYDSDGDNTAVANDWIISDNYVSYVHDLNPKSKTLETDSIESVLTSATVDVTLDSQ